MIYQKLYVKTKSGVTLGPRERLRLKITSLTLGHFNIVRLGKTYLKSNLRFLKSTFFYDQLSVKLIPFRHSRSNHY